MCELLERIPQEGDSIKLNGFKFTVTQMDDKRVASVLVQNLLPVEVSEE